MCGCMTQRYAGRYGDGTPYDGIGDAKTFRKFYIRSFDIPDGYRARVSPAKIQEIIPELVNSRAVKGDVPIDVTIRPGEVERGGGWTMVFLFLGGIVPCAFSADQDVVVEVSLDDMRDSCCYATSHFAHDTKQTVLSPLAAFPYSPREGFQENLLDSGILMQDTSEVFSRTIAFELALVLRRFAIERLAVPDVDFDFEGEGEES